jgi:hypothetical protein
MQAEQVRHSRYTGDVPDPRDGIRYVIPAKAAYWQGE